MNMTMIVNAHVNLKLELNVKMKMKMNIMLQMGMICWRFAGSASDRSRPRGGRRRHSTTLSKAFRSDEADMTRQQLRGVTPDVAVFWQQIDHQVCGYAQAHIW
jgi:hypothetical protein